MDPGAVTVVAPGTLGNAVSFPGEEIINVAYGMHPPGKAVPAGTAVVEEIRVVVKVTVLLEAALGGGAELELETAGTGIAAAELVPCSVALGNTGAVTVI